MEYIGSIQFSDDPENTSEKQSHIFIWLNWIQRCV